MSVSIKQRIGSKPWFDKKKAKICYERIQLETVGLATQGAGKTKTRSRPKLRLVPCHQSLNVTLGVFYELVALPILVNSNLCKLSLTRTHITTVYAGRVCFIVSCISLSTFSEV